jgi:predicted PurR-regulated permease PerM
MAAFILEPFVGLTMRLRLPRAVASFLVCAVAVCALYLVGLGVYAQTSGLVVELPKYQQRINDLTEEVLARIEAAERAVVQVVVPKRLRERQEEVAPPEPPKPVPPRARRRAPEPVLPAPSTTPAVQEVRIRPERPPVLDFFYAHLGSLYEWLLMASFVPFLVYFMLSWQDHIHRSFLQIFEDEEGRVVAEKTLDGIGMMVRAFVVGNFVLGLILAAATTLIVWLFRLPFPLLIGPVSGILSLVPYIGLPLAMLPPIFGALGVHSTMAPYLGLLGSIAVLHLLAMNLLYPKIVGTRVHLNPLVVTIGLMFWSVLWGAAGLILAIPLTAAIKAVCDHVPTLQPYGRILGD